jgi:tRNA(Arg) A34 adenosine deaminase TadA
MQYSEVKMSSTVNDKKLVFMRRAIELSAKGAREGGAPFGAVVVKNGKIVGEGHNVVVRSRDPSAHGEVVAIRDACKNLGTADLSGCEMYTSCEPCAMCTSAIWFSRFDVMYYGNSLQDTIKYCSMEGMFEDVGLDVEKRFIPAERLCVAEAFQVFSDCMEQKEPANVNVISDDPVEKEQFMRRAIELSSIGAKEGGLPFGAVVVKKGKIIGEGYNTVKLSDDPTAHGEVVAIRNACKALNEWDLDGCELYTSCEPCPLCVCVIWLCRFSKMYYANRLQDIVPWRGSLKELFEDVGSHIEKRSIPAERLCAEEACEVITSWGEQMGDKMDPRLGVAGINS